MDTSTPTPKPTTHTCTGTGCDQCLKGGMPMKKEMLSFLLIGFIMLSTVLGVLYINAKRESKSVEVSDESAESMVAIASPTPYPTAAVQKYTDTIVLPKPTTDGKLSLEKAIISRRSRREFSETPVTLTEISQMLWSGQGVTDSTGKRTAPSSRESYSMKLFVFVRTAKGLMPGVYEYLPTEHALGLVSTVDVTTAMKTAGVQAGAQVAPVNFLIASDFGVYQAKTKSADISATYMEAGHIGQNMYLEAESLGMATVTMAGFSSPKMVETLQLDPAYTIEYLLPFGHRAVATGSAAVAE